MRAAALLLALSLGLPARADVAEAVTGHALPGYRAFAAAAQDLSAAAAADAGCRPAPLRPAWNAAFDAWLGVAHLRLGPVEDEGRALAIAFWPDPKGAVPRTVAALAAAPEPDLADPAAVAAVSVAGRGLFALEWLLYAPDTGAAPDRACALVRALARDLAAMAGAIEAGWRDGVAAALTAPGPDGPYLDATEARQALFTQVVTGLEFVADQRIGRPLGTFDRPRPERAEARLSGRSIANIRLSLAAIGGLVAALDPGALRTQAALAQAGALAARLPDDALGRLGDPEIWLRVQILQQAVHAARDAALAELGPALGVGIGFNAADGD